MKPSNPLKAEVVLLPLWYHISKSDYELLKIYQLVIHNSGFRMKML